MNEKVHPPAESLNALLRVELAAVLAYRNALRSLDGRLGTDSERIHGLYAGHQRTVSALQTCVLALGGVPTLEAGTWGSFSLLRDVGSLRHLLEAEERGLAAYETALPLLDGEVRELVEKELMPRQRQHVVTLSGILKGAGLA